MTRATNARIAGFTFLFYIASGVTSMALSAQIAGDENLTAKLGSIVKHMLQLRVTIVLGLLQAVCAIVLAVTLYSLTRNEDVELALLSAIRKFGGSDRRMYLVMSRVQHSAHN